MNYKTTTELSKAAAILGKIGGSRSSEKKTKAVRENAKLGGRPKMLNQEQIKALKTGLETILRNAKELGQGAVDMEIMPELPVRYVVNVYDTPGGIAVVAKFEKAIKVDDETTLRVGVGSLRKIGFDVKRI